MPLIACEVAGLRLARALVMDLRVYNERKIQPGADLNEEMAEARSLYRERVEASLYPLFEVAIADLLPTETQGVSSTAAVTTDISGGARHRLGSHEGLFRGEQRRTKPAPQPIVVAVLFVLVIVGIAAAWIRTR